MTRLRASRFGEAGSACEKVGAAYEPEDPDVDEPVDEVDELLPVEDVEVLSDAEDVPEDAAGLAPSPEDFPSPVGFLA